MMCISIYFYRKKILFGKSINSLTVYINTNPLKGEEGELFKAEIQVKFWMLLQEFYSIQEIELINPTFM